MDSLKNMLSAMHGLGVYDLSNYSAVYKELQSYAAGFDIVSDLIDEIIKECFLMTAEDSGLEEYEKIIGAPQTEYDTVQRRNMLVSLFNINENDFTLDGIRRCFDSLNFECEIYENPKNFDVLIIPKDTDCSEVRREYIRQRAAEFMPFHLTYTIEFRTADWDTYDRLNNNFDKWDSLNADWDSLDRYEGE